MTAFNLPIQTAIYSELSQDTALNALVNGRIYDFKPQSSDSGSDSEFPYVTIGNDFLLQWNNDQKKGVEGTINIHTWSRARGFHEIKRLQDIIRELFDKRDEMIVSGLDFVTMDFVDSESFPESDGKTFHGVQSFRILVYK